MSRQLINILVIDDDRGDRRLIELTLKNSRQPVDFAVETAPNLAQGLEFLKKGNVEVLLLDLGLPDSSGIDTVKQVFKIDPDVPIVVLTGLDDEETGLKAIKAGADDYLTKGKSLEYTLVRAIRHAIQRKTIQEELRGAMLAAQTANRTKSQFLANMSHEIRTPMNAILGFSDLLANESLTGEQKEYVNLIRQSGHGLLGLINDILDFSKIEAGRLDVDIVDCSLGKLLSGIKSLMRPLAFEKGLDFELNTAKSLPETIRTDPDRLRQCLINLINNAIKFTEQGHIHLTVFICQTDSGPMLQFDVEDTGIGIPEDSQQDVFDLFTQADGSASRRYEGTGLGLAITRQLAKLLGGTVSLSSQEGKGSVFSLAIPPNVNLDSTPHLQKRPLSESGSVGKAGQETELSGHILVAEDCPTNQMLMKVLLERLGLKVTIVEDGNQAVQKAIAGTFDMILMDIQMPHLNGYEATEQIREQQITTPIVALTANAMKGDDKKCLDAGCDAYLAKPVDQRVLLKILTKYLTTRNTPAVAGKART